MLLEPYVREEFGMAYFEELAACYSPWRSAAYVGTTYKACCSPQFQVVLDSCAPVSTGNTFQDLPRLRETADNTERYI
jgi:hypothetical protein